MTARMNTYNSRCKTSLQDAPTLSLTSLVDELMKYFFFFIILRRYWIIEFGIVRKPVIAIFMFVISKNVQVFILVRYLIRSGMHI